MTFSLACSVDQYVIHLVQHAVKSFEDLVDVPMEKLQCVRDPEWEFVEAMFPEESSVAGQKNVAYPSTRLHGARRALCCHRACN